MLIITLLKDLCSSMKHPTGRFNYLQGLLRNVPGQVGMTLRNNLLPKYFCQCGEGVFIQEGVRFINIHNISVGQKVGIGSGSYLQGAGEIEIGDNVLLGPDVKIWSTNHQFNDTDQPIVEQGYEHKKVIIGEGCWLGANVIILPGVSLPKGCVVSAGSVVGIKRYPDYALLAGHPSRVIGTRLKR